VSVGNQNLKRKRIRNVVLPEKTSCTKRELFTLKEKYRNLVDATSDLIWQIDQNGFYTYVSPKIKDLLGYEPTEILGKTPFDLMPKWEAKKIAKEFTDFLKDKRPFFNLENWNLHKNGSLVLLETTGIPFYDEKGQFVGYQGIDRDITERKQIEAALKESEQLYRVLFDNSDDGFLLVEPIFEKGKVFDFRFLKLNKSYERQTCFKAAEVLGKRAREVSYFEENIFLLVLKVAKTGKSVHTEEYFKSTFRWFDAYYFLYAHNKVGILYRDITTRKQAQEALKQSEEKYRLYFESSPVAFFVADKNQKYIQVNDAASSLLGYTKGEFLKMTIFDIVFKEDLAVTHKQYNDLVEHGRSITEFRLKRKDGQPVYVILNTTLLSDGKAMAFCEDITERKKLEKLLQDNERLAAIGATANMVGHDIRNPLQAILSDVFLIKSELASLHGEIGVNVTESLANLETNIMYINKIVADLQDYSRTLSPDLKNIEFSDVIVNVLNIVYVPENISLTINLEELPLINTDPAMLQRVLTNLVNNAVQAMPNGGKLDISSFIKESKLFIIVSDTGVGIPEEIKSKLFEPMFTTKAKGQGLGLAVAKRLTKSLGGNITFESQKGVGTQFTVELPLFSRMSD
jgi:PAS domain S-box-containing protein